MFVLFSGSHSKAAWYREVATLGHLGGMFDQLGIVKSLRSVVPYRVKWCDVALNVSHEVVPRSQILYAINGNVVALCIADDKQVMLYYVRHAMFWCLDYLETFSCSVCPVRRMGSGAVVCPDLFADFALFKLFIWLLNFLSCFLPSLYFLPYFIHLVPDLSTSSRIGPFRFQARGRRRRPNLDFITLTRSINSCSIHTA